MTRKTSGPADVPPLPSPKERRRLREARELSEEQVATAVGVTPATIRAWETGRTSPRGRRRVAYARIISSADPRASAGTAPPTRRGGSPDAGAEPGTTAGPEALEAAQAAEAPAAATLAEVTETTQTTGASEGPGNPGSPELPEVREAPETSAGARPTEPAQDTERAPDTAPGTEPDTASDPAPVPAGLTAAEAFDTLYTHTAPGLVRQAYVLTGRRQLAGEAVEHAFQLAWHRWPEVARDRDPAGWVRAAAYEYAMSPWHRMRRGHRRPDALPEDQGRRALLGALLDMPPSYRRTLLLHDGVGLGLAETAAETEASTPATAGRLVNARTAVAERLPELARHPTPAGQSALLHERLGALALAERVPAPPPAEAVRTGGERRARQWTRAVVCFGVLLAGATGFTLSTAPTQYVAPISPAARVEGVPVLSGPGKLTPQDLKLQKALHGELAHGPERLVPQVP
ncbi:helix-turn-helix domain-containing protein [Streptomyces sp. NBC_01754]|uniref:helix-turn-helix domain-containing protein n=1 Tax=Streptomyces sp. NBC_01754 TaxID=2975930 RepID=UPI002DDA35C2|nr:helix-turn-helix domain-containing protein [Streptomyces sp. NBC_01754]WSC94405.1 helix-turn-helix domain-containing protein [Streptomyces sp. NBC_01754]